tara:strand:- start:38 stop:367 length:330 start_codon:yes stop_codon:yes gene_type:complete
VSTEKLNFNPPFLLKLAYSDFLAVTRITCEKRYKEGKKFKIQFKNIKNLGKVEKFGVNPARKTISNPAIFSHLNKLENFIILFIKTSFLPSEDKPTEVETCRPPHSKPS